MSRRAAVHAMPATTAAASPAPAESLAPPAIDHTELAKKTYLNAVEATAYLSFPSVPAFREWARRKAVPKCNAGGVLFLRRDLDEVAQRTRRSRHLFDNHGEEA